MTLMFRNLSRWQALGQKAFFDAPNTGGPNVGDGIQILLQVRDKVLQKHCIVDA
jgi:hypothetical protein